MTTYDDDVFRSLVTRLTEIKCEASRAWSSLGSRTSSIRESNLASARNLVHYLALRCHDIRDLQRELARVGISSLGRSESHVMSNVEMVLRLLRRLTNQAEETGISERALSLDEGRAILVRRTDELLGPPPPRRRVRIMVTLPSEAADDYALVRDLITNGMDCARINCAHDGLEAWQRIIDNILRGREETGKDCRICIDIAGPKLRTGQFRPGPQVLKWRPTRDRLGRVITPATIWLTSTEDPTVAPRPATAEIQMTADVIGWLQINDRIKFRDARNKRRHLTVRGRSDGGLWLESRQTAYIVPETEFECVRSHHHHSKRIISRVSNLPAIEQYATLRIGDSLILTRDPVPGTPEVARPDGTVIRPASVSCTLPEVFDQVKVGETIWLDDGALGGFISDLTREQMVVKITHAGPKGHRLRADKGINLPDSNLRLAPLTERDLEDLKFVVKNADSVGYSFVRTAHDISELQNQLKHLGGEHLGIILKIETRAAFENLPELLLALMESRSGGVMIARGDLAVEVGFERLAEIQEEIMWMCEAAHLPVIWATQVLEQLSKKGVFSRAEITDAAMAERAECVMLNKGPFVLDAVRTLDDILTRMQPHQDKKRSMMRPLALATRFFDSPLP